jgi:hypothetical protein
MRSPLRCLDAIWPSAILLAGLGLTFGERPLAAQVAPPPPVPTSPSIPGTARTGPGGQGEDESNNPMMRQLSEQQANRRNNLRQKVIVDDTARLLTLAQQLKEQTDKGRIEPSASDFARKLDEIEKLAKTVKDKMREGQ